MNDDHPASQRQRPLPPSSASPPRCHRLPRHEGPSWCQPHQSDTSLLTALCPRKPVVKIPLCVGESALMDSLPCISRTHHVPQTLITPSRTEPSRTIRTQPTLIASRISHSGSLQLRGSPGDPCTRSPRSTRPSTHVTPHNATDRSHWFHSPSGRESTTRRVHRPHASKYPHRIIPATDSALQTLRTSTLSPRQPIPPTQRESGHVPHV